MTTVSVGYGISDPTHDLSLTDGTTTVGLIFAGGPRVLQEIPLTPPAQAFEIEQRNWIGGRGRVRYEDDPTGFYDSQSLWTTTDGRIMPQLQWRFGSSQRTSTGYLPADGHTYAWWKLYGNTPASNITRYISVSNINGFNGADKGYLWIRPRGSPGVLTFELRNNNAGDPGTVITTVTLSDFSDKVSAYKLFDWTGTQNLPATFHIVVYGAATDDADNHWEVLGNSGLSASKYSADGSTWTFCAFTLYFRVTDADTNRQWRFFTLEGALYAVDQKDSGAASTLLILGARGTASSATTTTLTNSGATMTTDWYINSYIRIFDGTGDGQVRKITANTATQFTVTPAWDITPDTTSRYVVYATDAAAAAGVPGLGAVKGKPIVVGSVAYFPQGQSTNIRRMRVNGNSHDYADDGTNKADIIYLNVEGTAPLVYVANSAAATIQSASVVPWSTNLTLSTAKQVGGSEWRITNLHSHNKVMRIFKEDGVYTYNNGIIEQDGQNFSDAPDPTNGLGVGVQNGALWWGWAHSIERQVGSSVDDMMNFKRGYEGMPDGRKGYVSCIVSAVGWLFFVIDGGADNYSSIISWNGMGWHEIFRGWAEGVRIRNAYWQANVNARGRLWFDVGGDLAYIEFPRYAANPMEDSNSTDGINYMPEGTLITPTYSAGDEHLYKVFATLRVFHEAVFGKISSRVRTTVSTEVDYQYNTQIGTNTWNVLGTMNGGQLNELALNLGQVSKIRFRFRLQSPSSRRPTVIAGWQIAGRMMQIKKYQYLATFKTDSDQTTFTDEPDHEPNALYSQLQTWAQYQNKLTMRTQSSSSDSKAVTISFPSKSVDWIDSGESKWGGRISIAILEV